MLTSSPTTPDSRYYGSPTCSLTQPDGTVVRYLARRIVPQPEQYTSIQQFVVVEGARLDNVAAQTLGNPLLFWMLCDANLAMDPDDLTSQPGRSISIPLPAGISSGG
ncbi:LysM domain-containing protein [Burkholderia sp. R-69980]|nr:LysM domain-containing protein [Burkholderia sp. R-69980]